MDKPKSLSMWTVARDINDCKKVIWYGSFNELVEENGEHYVEIPFENWLSEDLTEIFGNELEDCNYHSWTWLPESLLQTLKANKTPESKRFNIILEMHERWYYDI